MSSAASLMMKLGKLLGIQLILFSLCRVIFIALNSANFDYDTLGSLLNSFLQGLRFDISAILMVNGIFAFLVLFPLPFASNKYWQKVLKYWFLVTNGVSILLNLIDAIYYPFIQKRMQFDALSFVTGEKGGDFYQLLPTFLIQYWYIWLLFSLIMVVLYKSYDKVAPNLYIDNTWKAYGFGLLAWLFGVGLFVLGIRGGLQLRPISIINASMVSKPQNIAVVLNTPFSIIKTIEKVRLEPLHYVEESALDNCSLGTHQPMTATDTSKWNVVVLVVESLSKKYVGLFNEKAKTPFLDSLLSQSLLFENGFANARESIQGIPAIVASIPAWQNEAFILSPYASNRVTSIANTLKNKGYASSFFHGGTNGTMGFNAFASLAGFDQYHGRTEYANEADFDGHWGIWDEPFLQYMVQQLNTSQQPFVSLAFTMNPHHPFINPPQYKERFKQDGHPIYSNLQFVDFALKRFFDTAKSSPWYKHTIFVITADHTAPNIDGDKSVGVENFQIPIAFFKADGSLKGRNKTIASQIDILPTLLSMLSYDAPFISLGKNLLAPDCPKNAINYNGTTYQYIDESYCYQFNEQVGIGLYNWVKDREFNKNLIKDSAYKPIKDRCDIAIKKAIQVYRDRMIDNKLQN